MTVSGGGQVGLLEKVGFSWVLKDKSKKGGEDFLGRWTEYAKNRASGREV